MVEGKYIHNKINKPKYKIYGCCENKYGKIEDVALDQICAEIKEYLYENFYIECNDSFYDVDWDEVDKNELCNYLFDWLDDNMWCGLNREFLVEMVKNIIEKGYYINE